MRRSLRRFWDRWYIAIACVGCILLVGGGAWLEAHIRGERALRNCTAVCDSHGHERFPIEGNACFCAGPEGAYSPGLTEQQRSTTLPVTVPVVIPVRR